MKLEAKHFYMALPVMLLGMSVTIQMTAATMASRGNDAEIERDYYDRAVNWDSYQKDVAASRALGWTLAIEPEPFRAARLEHDVVLRITDGQGAPVTGLVGSVSAFQTAHVDETVVFVPVEDESGVYRARFKPQRFGNWIWRYDFSREGQRFVGEALEFLPEAAR